MGIPMFNESWIALPIVLIIAGLLLRQPAILAVAGLILTVAGVSWTWNRYALHGVEYERAFSERRVFQGELVELIVRVTNRKLLPLSWLAWTIKYRPILPWWRGRYFLLRSPIWAT